MWAESKRLRDFKRGRREIKQRSAGVGESSRVCRRVPTSGAVGAVKPEESEGPPCVPTSGSVRLKVSWRALKSSFRGEACSCGCERAPGGLGVAEAREVHCRKACVLLVCLSDPILVENVLSKVSFLVALLGLPPSSSTGAAVRECSVEAVCALVIAVLWVPIRWAWPWLWCFGLSLIVGCLSYKLGMTSGSRPGLEIGFPRSILIL